MAKFARRLITFSLLTVVTIFGSWFFGPATIGIARAQNNTADALLASYALPAIHVTALDATQNGNTVAGKFTVKNSEQASFGNLQYQILLVGPAPKLVLGKVTFNNAPVYDHKIINEKFDLPATSEKSFNFSYTVPPVATGDYRVRVQVLTTKGTELGWKDFPLAITATADVANIVLTMDGITIDDKPVDVSVLDGVNVAPAKNIVLNFSAQNTAGKEIKVTPTLGIWEFAKNRLNVAQIKGEVITLKKGANKLTIPVLTAEKPEAYAAELALQNEAGTTQISNVLSYRWVVTGPSAEISSVRITKPVFNKGETFGAEVEAVGSADRQTTVKAQIELSVQNGNTVIASNKSEFVTLNSRPKSYAVTVGLNSDVKNPTIRTRIIDENGTVLDEDLSQITGSPKTKQFLPVSNTANSKSSQGASVILTIVVAILALIIIVAVFMIIKGKNKPTIIMLLFIVSMVAFSFWATTKTSGANASFTCSPALSTSGNGDTNSPIDCSGYSFGTWTTHYECWQPNRLDSKAARWCSGDVLFPESRIFINNASLDNSLVSTVTNGKYLVPVEGYITTVACGNKSNVDYSASVFNSDDTTKVTIADGSFKSGGSSEHPESLFLKDFSYLAAFNAVRQNYTGNIVFNIKDIFCGMGTGRRCSGEHEFTETLTLKINFPAPLSCAVTPPTTATASKGTVFTFKVSGGDATKKYRWVSSNPADVFSPAQGAETTLTPNVGKTSVKVINGAFLDVDGSGTVNDADKKLVLDYLNMSTAQKATVNIPLTDEVGQNQKNPLDVNSDGTVNAMDSLSFTNEMSAGYTIPKTTCATNITIAQASAAITVTANGVKTTKGGTVAFGSITQGETKSINFSVINSGDNGSQLNVTGIALAKNGASAYAFVPPLSAVTASLAQNETKDFVLQFAPDGVKSTADTLQVSYSDPNTGATGTFSLSLAGTNIVPPAKPEANLWIVTKNDTTATTLKVVKGSTVTLGWSSNDADSCTASSESGDWNGPKASNGTGTVTPSKTTNTYTLFCSKNGINSPAKSVTVETADSVSGTNIRDL